MRALAFFFALVLLSQAADPPTVRSLAITVGKGELLQFDRDVSRVAIAEPRIADAIIVSQRDVMVNAKGPGQTTLVIWENEAAAPTQYDITVQNDTTQLAALQKSFDAELRQALPGAQVEFSGNAEAMVLTGKATPDQSKRAEALASTYSKKVVNLIELPDRRQILLQVKFASVDRTALSQFGFNLFSRNPTTVGSTSTQQFQQPLFTQLQF